MSEVDAGIARVNKRDFLQRVAQRAGVPFQAVQQMYWAFVEELMDSARRREIVVLTGFGRFYLQVHRGHRVRFGKKDVPDYSVLKFSASARLNRALDKAEAPGEQTPAA